MKKLLLTAALSSAFAAASFGQGYIIFGNGTSTKVSVNAAVNGTTYTAIGTTANSYYFALFYSASATSVLGSSAAVVGGSTADTSSAFVTSDSNWTLDPGVLGVNGTRAGFMGDASGASETAVPLASATTGEFVVLGWSANIGSSEANVLSFLNGTDVQNSAAVLSGWVGESAVGDQVLSPGTPSPVNSIFGAAPQVPGFALGEVVIPEPSTIALGVMGAASLLALRRKKA